MLHSENTEVEQQESQYLSSLCGISMNLFHKAFWYIEKHF